MSQLDKKTVEKIAKLANLELTEAEISKFTEQLASVIDYNVEKLNQVKTDNVEPLLHATGLTNSTAEDVPEPSLTSQEVLKNAPEKSGEFFKVKQILDQP